jgi:hypothetical protein
MAIKRKGSSKKLYIAIFLVVILIASTATIIYAIQPAPVEAKAGVNVGDSFAYGIIGTSTLTGLDAVETPGFSQYNQTDYFKITITGASGTSVSFDTLWRFKNGTEIPGKQTIDLSNGNKTDSNGFWAIYAANLNVGDLLRPAGFDKLTVNATDTKTYTSGSRTRNFWFIENMFRDVNDPTGSTQRYDYIGVWFDKKTGMLGTLTNYSEYNNPAKIEITTWNLVSSSVWAV